MNILPNNIFNGVNSNGTTFAIREWDIKTIGNLQVTAFLITLFIAFLSCSIISPILLIVCLIQLDNRVISNNLVGIIIGGYFLIDCTHDWLSIRALNILCDTFDIKFMIALNIASLITHLCILFVGCLPKLNKTITFIIMFVVFLLAFEGGFGRASNIGKIRFDKNAKRDAIAKENAKYNNED